MHQFVKSVLLVIGVTGISNVSAGTPILVKTNVGPISGSNDSVMIDGSMTYVARFTNIPFGETTAGANRFAKPIPKAPFSEVLNATGKPVACFQYSTQVAPRPQTFTEDCLILNIYAPHDFQKGTPLDVMVWIYGGGFIEGFTSFYQPEGLSTFGNVIVVTVSYRIGMFGFLNSADGRLTGNQGLWDQHLGIKWVHDNIAAFNGNPGHVTIFGESAGGASVFYQALYPGNKGLFQRVIAESGTPLAGWAYNNTPNAAILASMKGCDQGKVDPIACLRALPASQLQIDPDEYYNIVFNPSLDGEFLLGTPEELLLGTDSVTEPARHLYGSLDIIMGANNYDGMTVYKLVMEGLYKGIDIDTFAITQEQFQNDYIPAVVKDFLKPDSQDKMKVLEDLLNFQYIDWSTPNNSDALRMGGVAFGCDVFFFYPLFGAAESHALQNKGKTYVYEFSAKPNVHVLPTPAWVDGSNHGDDIPFVLGFPLYPDSKARNSSYSQDEINLSKAMMTMWTNFAATGDPNLSRDATMYTHSVWPPYNDMSQHYLNIDMKMSTIQEHFYATRMQLWSKLIPLVQRLGHSALPHHATTRPRERTTPPSAGPQPTQMFHIPDVHVGK